MVSGGVPSWCPEGHPRDGDLRTGPPRVTRRVEGPISPFSFYDPTLTRQKRGFDWLVNSGRTPPHSLPLLLVPQISLTGSTFGRHPLHPRGNHSHVPRHLSGQTSPFQFTPDTLLRELTVSPRPHECSIRYPRYLLRPFTKFVGNSLYLDTVWTLHL